MEATVNSKLIDLKAPFLEKVTQLRQHLQLLLMFWQEALTNQAGRSSAT